MRLHMSNEPAASAEEIPLRLALDRVIRFDEISIHFQPIVDVTQRAVLGFEALTRGPSHSPLHSPLVLFDIAARCGRLVELERRVVRLIVRRFVQLGLPGKLFLNVTADTLIAARDRAGLIAGEFASFDIPASRVVVELTETRPAFDQAGLKDAIRALCGIGFQMALDDLGEGFASLKRWVEMRPQYVKLDRHFVDGIAGDLVKQQLVRSIMEMARASGAQVIAEGLEQEDDLTQVRKLGVSLCQGYLFARPSQQPRIALDQEFERLLGDAGRSLPELALGVVVNAQSLARAGITVTPANSCQQVLDLFAESELVHAIPVLDADGRPLGIVRGLTAFKRGSERFFRDIFGRRSCTELMDPNPLSFDCGATLRTMSEAVAALNDRHMVDGFIVTRNGYYFGIGKMSELVKAVSDLQISCARYAHPLTLLPGNVPIDAHLERLLKQQARFTVVYWDIDHFKAFNDIYGYRAGDAMIQLVARLIVEESDSVSDFVGHVGGDDFVSIHCAADWEPRLRSVLDRFAAESRQLYEPLHWTQQGYVSLDRRGEQRFHPLCSLSAGVLPVSGDGGEHPAGIAHTMAELKSAAKRQPGNSYFVERRTRSAEGRGGTNPGTTEASCACLQPER
jgi:EAL domain-containing protein (putative c-di-GMP-specific phosphodiesterase class I)/GGDEF domain-containing protein